MSTKGTISDAGVFAATAKPRSVARFFIGACVGVPLVAAPAFAQEPSKEELWLIIQKQQKQIEQQQQQIDALAKRLDAADEKIEATGEMVDMVATEGAAGQPGWWQRTSLGGYGELHYEGGDKDEIDFHRFVLFVNHDFTEDIHLFSEVELEHALAGEGKEGEVELEQAFIRFDFNEDYGAVDTGLFLIPIGILNEKHEPPTFYGVERNRVETEIIPTTWWEAGAGLHYRFDNGVSTQLAVTSGLKVPLAGGNAFRIRSGRQKVSEADFEDPIFTGRIKWTGFPGVELAATGLYHTDVTQSQTNNDATMFETHADILYRGWGLRALGAVTNINGVEPEAFRRDEQWGFYLEPSYRFFLADVLGPDRDWGEFGVFTRFSKFNTRAGDDAPAGVRSDVQRGNRGRLQLLAAPQRRPQIRLPVRGPAPRGWRGRPSQPGRWLPILTARSSQGEGRWNRSAASAGHGFAWLAVAFVFTAPVWAIEDIYQLPEDFLAETFSGDVPDPKVLWITKVRRPAVEKVLGHPYWTLRVRYWQRDNRTVWILEDIGKVKPITVGYVVSNGVIERVKVLIYRESHGWEVRYPFFTDQFKGRRLRNTVLDERIDGISGATLSVNTLTRLAALALYLHGEAVPAGGQ